MSTCTVGLATCPTHGHMTLYILLFIQDEWGNTALMRACIEGHMATADLLLNKGATVNYLNEVILMFVLIFACVVSFEAVISCPLLH